MESNANADVDKLITFGEMALEQGWIAEARAYFEQALALDADNREAMKGLARANEILSRRVAMAVEPTEVKTRTEPSLAERVSLKVNSALEWMRKEFEESARRSKERPKERPKERSRERAEANKGRAPMQLFTPRFTVVHLGGIPDMKPGKKTLIRLKRDGLEVGQWGVRGHRTIPFESIKDLNYAPQGFEAGPTTGQQVAIGVLLPFAFPLAILGYALAKERKEPMLAISYRLGGNVTAHALFGGKQAGKLYQKLLKLAAK